jgi:glucan phosphoethanolaminetransferase (alkaline phosphatase superfamily)
MNSSKDFSLQSRIISFIFTVLYYSAILYYLYNLEDVDCNCIRDWRHNFIKGMSILGIFIGLINLIGFNSQNQHFLVIILLILGIINFYAFFTYIGDLNATNCVCAVDKQPSLNIVMQVFRWMPIIILGLAIVSVIVLIIIGFRINQYLKK